MRFLLLLLLLFAGPAWGQLRVTGPDIDVLRHWADQAKAVQLRAALPGVEVRTPLATSWM